MAKSILQQTKFCEQRVLTNYTNDMGADATAVHDAQSIQHKKQQLGNNDTERES
jgi:hypothetical protein